MNDVGGWPTVAGIYTFFAGLAGTGWAAGTSTATGKSRLQVAGRAATVPELIGRPEHTVFAFGATPADTAQLTELLDCFGSVVTVDGSTGPLADPSRHLATFFGIRPETSSL